MTTMVTMASIPEREDTLAIAVESLRKQCDFLSVYLNGYDESRWPAYFSGAREDGASITLAFSQKNAGDLGDAGKFDHPAMAKPNLYHLTCDDDLEYPPDYVEEMVRAVDRYDRRAVVGLHGVVLKRPLGATYEQSRETVYHFAEALRHDMPVHLLGTGCMAYHTKSLWVASIAPKPRNMADIWFAVACQKARVPRVCIAHEAGWVRQLPFTSSIWDQRKNDPKLVEALRQGEPWDLQLTPCD